MKGSRIPSQVKRTALAVMLIVALLASAGAVAALQGPRGVRLQEAEPVVSFDPNPIEVGLGTMTSVDVNVDNIEGLYAIEVRLAYPNSLVQAVDADTGTAGIQAQPGDVFEGFDTYMVQNRVDNATGVVEYIVSITGSEVGFDGSGTILTLPLEGLALGDAVMSFVEVILCERDGTSIPVILGNGQSDIVVVEQTSTPTPTLEGGQTAEPTETPTPGPSPTTGGGLPEVVIVPVDQQIAVGNQTIVRVDIRNVTDLYLFDIRLDFSGVILDAIDGEGEQPGIQCYMGDVFDAFPYQVQDNVILDDGIFGQAHMLATINTGQAQGFDGDAVLFWIVVEGAVPGISNMTLAEVILADHSGTGIERTLTHGQVEVTGEVPTVTPTETEPILATSTWTATPEGTLTQTPTLTATPLGTTPVETSTTTPTGLLETPTPVCSNLIVNGGFETIEETNAPPWQVSGSTTFTSIEHKDGAYSAWLGGYNNIYDVLYQTVAIPAHPDPDELLTEATLSLWWGMTTTETSHPNDSMWVRIRDANGNLLEDLMTVTDESLSGQWTYAEFDVSAYEGQTIRISFEADTNGSLPTSFWVDTVQLIMCEVLKPQPTSTASVTPTISPTATQTGLPTGTPTITPTPIVETVQYDEGTYENCYDAYLSSWTPDENYGHTGAMSCRTGGAKRPVIYFDVSHLPDDITILNANLWLYSSHYKSHPPALTVSVYGLKKPWQEMQATWLRADDATEWTLTGADDTILDRDQDPSGSTVVSDTNAWHAFDVTSLVQEWSDNTRTNNGMVLIGSGNTVEMSFWTSEYSLKDLRPKIIIEYTYGSVGTPQPTVTPNVSPTDGPTPTVTVTPAPMGNEMILQEDYQGYTGVEDTYISKWEPTNQYGGNVTLLVRYGDVRASLVRFDVSALPTGATIHDAKLEMYAVSRSNEGVINMGVYPVARPWAEGQATWIQATAADAWGLEGCNDVSSDRSENPVDTQQVSEINEWVSWDVTSLVQGWVGTPGTNRGVVIKGSGTSAVEFSFAASEYWWAQELSPRLVVRYSAP